MEALQLRLQETGACVTEVRIRQTVQSEYQDHNHSISPSINPPANQIVNCQKGFIRQTGSSDGAVLQCQMFLAFEQRDAFNLWNGPVAVSST